MPRSKEEDAVRKRKERSALRISAPRIMPRSTEDDAARKRKERSFAAQVAAQHKRTVQDAVFPTSDADRKRVTRSVAAQVAAQHKRTVQDAVFPTTNAERMRFTRQQARQARERNAAEATAAIAAEAAAAAEDGVDSVGAIKTQRAQARIAPRKSVMVEMEQVPLRPANVVTSYVIQGSQFDRQIIFETSPTEFYTQMSRSKTGLDGISIAEGASRRCG